MSDRRRGAELESAQELGRLSDEMVFSLGRVVRNGPDRRLAQGDLRWLGLAAQLFDLLAADDAGIPDGVGSMMFGSAGYLDALHVVEERADAEQSEVYARRAADLLRNVVDRQMARDDEMPLLQSLRGLFETVGEVTLSRADDLSSAQDQYWPPLRQAI